ncbi:hypothetical protein [Kitasatospora sp. NPDC089509]|uniref:hypothetical protein n=1 Tax=Kitasatospora sp. NPDC089509 TaxID=3364079 RepID=UPI00381F2AFF
MTSRAEANRITRERAEELVSAVLKAEGYAVTNLNQLAGNFPLADLIARRETRLLVQVRGTTISEGKYRTPPQKARTFNRLGVELGCPAVYAFAHLAPEQPVVRFALATEVAELAEEDEANYSGVNAFHVNIGQFEIGVSRLQELLGHPR